MAKPHPKRPPPPAKAPAPQAPAPAAPAPPAGAAASEPAAAPTFFGRAWRQAVWVLTLLGALGFMYQDSVLRYNSLDVVTNSFIGIPRATDQAKDPAAPLNGLAAQRLGMEKDPSQPSGYVMNQHPLVVPALGTDGYHWMMQTEQMLHDGDARVRHSNYDNPPHGRDIHWSGSLHWWTLLGAWIKTKFTPMPLALAIAEVGPWINTVCLALIMVLLVPVVVRRFGWLPGALLAAGFVATYPFFEFYTTGYLDHHGLAATSAMLTVLFLVGGGAGWLRADAVPPEKLGHGERMLWDWLPERASARGWFIASGIVGGAGLWISAASLVPSLFGIGLAVVVGTLVLGRDADPKLPWRPDPTLWRVWGLAGAASSIFFYLLEYFPSDFSMRLEVNHPLYALAWAGAGDLLCRLSQWWYDEKTPAAQVGARVLAGAAIMLVIIIGVGIGGSILQVSDAARARGLLLGVLAGGAGAALGARAGWDSLRRHRCEWMALDLLMIAALPALILLFKENTFVITDKFLWALHEDYILEFRSLERQLSYLSPVQIAGGISLISVLVFGVAVLLWAEDFRAPWNDLWRLLLLLILVPGVMSLHFTMFPLVKAALEAKKMLPIDPQAGTQRIAQARQIADANPAQAQTQARVIAETQQLLEANRHRVTLVCLIPDLILLAVFFILPVARGPPKLPRPWLAVLLLAQLPALVMLCLALRQVRWLGIGCALWVGVLVVLAAVALRLRYLQGRVVLAVFVCAVVGAAAGLGLENWWAAGLFPLATLAVFIGGHYFVGFNRTDVLLTAVLPVLAAVLLPAAIVVFSSDFLQWLASKSSAPVRPNLDTMTAGLQAGAWGLALVVGLAGAVCVARRGLAKPDWIKLLVTGAVLWALAALPDGNYAVAAVLAAGAGLLLAAGARRPAAGTEPLASGIAGIFLAIVLLPFIAFTYYQWNRLGWRYPPGELELTQIVTRDVSLRLRKRLGNEPGVIVSGPTTTTWMTYFGGFKGLGTLYWENIDGLKATAAIYSARTPEEAYELVQRYGVTHLAIYSWDPFAIEYARLARGERLDLTNPDAGPQDAFVLSLLRGPRLPPWLRPLPYRMVDTAILKGANIWLYEVVPPQSPEAFAVTIAQYYLEMDHLQDSLKAAEITLNQLLEKRPDYLPALALRAYVYYKQQRLDAFNAAMQEVVNRLGQADSLNLNDRVQLGMDLALSRRSAQAREQIAAAVAMADETTVRHLAPYILVNFVGLARQLGLDQSRPEIMALATSLLAPENRADSLSDIATQEAAAGRVPQAVAHFRQALENFPGHPAALNRLAWLLATYPDPPVRNGPEAVKLAEQAARQSRYQDVQALDILASAYAETGQFAKAVEYARRALNLAQLQGNAAAVDAVRQRLAYFEQGQPFHTPPQPGSGVPPQPNVPPTPPVAPADILLDNPAPFQLR